jgi:DNA-binding NarL/FixJ family response regulator
MLSANQAIPSNKWGAVISSGVLSSGSAREMESQFAKCDAPCVFVVVERNEFLRDCLLRSLSKNWPGGGAAVASLSDMAQTPSRKGSTVVLLSIISLNEEEAAAEFALLMELAPPARSIVLAKTDDLHQALAALNQGANGYISMTACFEDFVQAILFVGAGGTYVPAQCLLAARQAVATAPEPAPVSGITNREMAVIQAIRQGKPNKVIAFELNMCESTVKVHVRHLMKKLNARNRTDLAMKATDLGLASVRRGVGAPPALLADEL